MPSLGREILKDQGELRRDNDLKNLYCFLWKAACSSIPGAAASVQHGAAASVQHGSRSSPNHTPEKLRSGCKACDIMLSHVKSRKENESKGRYDAQ